MLSINTNLSSLIAQSSMKTSTDKLNQAIEKMTTGFKINHAKDNAANYSISTNLTTQLSAYDTAADNVAMGMDLVNYASDIISQMQDKAARLNALSTQARNGTYGAQSLSALNSEANAIMSELMRLYSTAEYNDISLFNRTAYTIASHLPQAGASGFIDETALISMATVGNGAGIAPGEVVGTTTEAPIAKAEYNSFIYNPVNYSEADLATMQSVSEAIQSGGLQPTGTYKVSTVEDLEALAYIYSYSADNVFVLANDIDLEQWCTDHNADGGWTPIGKNTNTFKGTFDGNGHVIKNLKIDRETSNYQGLFGFVSADGEIKNIGLENVDIKGQDQVGGLAGHASSSISNSYATGVVSGQSYVGGLAGYASSSISNSYATGDAIGTGDRVGGLAGYASSISNSYATGNVSGTDSVGGLAGDAYSSISNSYATGAVTGTSNYVGGLAGYAYSSSTISNSYATGVVSGQSYVGGLAGYASSISNSYATGDVIGTGDRVGGLAGYSSSSISNSYATGAVTGSSSCVGGLVGLSSGEISNSYAKGDVTGLSSHVGGLVGSSYSSSNSSSITNSYATGDVNGAGIYVGGLAGYSPYTLTNSYATGDTTSSSNYVGGLVGYVYDSGCTLSNSYATGDVSGTGNYVGGLAGYSSSISNSYATGSVSGVNNVGGLAGNAYSSISNSYATGSVSGVNNVGGLTGSASSISNSYATGSVSGQSYVGGLAGSSSSISNSYATGNVSGTDRVGGLAGEANYSSISNSYATGSVSGQSDVGGLAGYADSSTISNSYATGNVSGTDYVGGIVGRVYCVYDDFEITDTISYSSVNGNEATGSFVGGVEGYYYYEWNFGDGDEGVDEFSGELLLNKCSAISNNNFVGGYYKTIEYDISYTDPTTGDYIENMQINKELDTTFDLSVYEAKITAVPLKQIATNLQVGIYGNSSSQLSFNTNFSFDLNIDSGIESVDSFNAIVSFENILSEKATQLGAIQNRLDSALESIEVNINNLTSTRSTIRDADIAEVSSQYIQQQILQQAAATLMATANQSPAIALQLI